MTHYEKIFNTYVGEPLRGGGVNKTTTCPSCGKTAGLAVNIQKGTGQCFSCELKVNHISITRAVHEGWWENTPESYLEEIRESRGISVDTLAKAQIAWDADRERWLLPYKNVGTINYSNLGMFKPEGDKAFVIYKCSNDSQEYPLTFYNPFEPLDSPGKGNEILVITEGEWDALAMLDIISMDTEDEDRPFVIGCPGASIIPSHAEKYLEAFDTIYLIYDNDEKGREGQAKMLAYLISINKEVKVFDWNQVDFPEGTDVRDILNDYSDLVTGWQWLSPYFIEVDPEDIAPTELSPGYIASIESIELIETLDDYFEKYNKYIRIDRVNKLAMITTLATATSMYMPGEPLWFFLVAVAGAGKTAHIESYGGSNELYEFVSKITAKTLVSGWAAGGDNSLLPKLVGKCLFIKDFTTILGAPADQQREMFSILRDAYDGSLKIPYGNGQRREYHNLNFNLVAGVTDAIYKHNDADMGERFLRVSYMAPEYSTDAILDSVMNTFGRSETKKQSLTEATLGYVRKIMLNKWDFTNNHILLSKDDKFFLGSLAKYTALVRTKPNFHRQDGLTYRPKSEVPTRLTLQLLKLAFAATKVVEPEWDNPDDNNTLTLHKTVKEVLYKVAIDTSEGFTQDIIRFIQNNEGCTESDICYKLDLPPARVNRSMRDLRVLRFVKERHQSSTGGRPANTFRLSDKFTNIMFEMKNGLL